MLGVSQPGNPPSSLRHSASFSCLQRGSGAGGEGHHRARTSTLPQQPSLQLNVHHQYGGLSSLQHRNNQQSSSNTGLGSTGNTQPKTSSSLLASSESRARDSSLAATTDLSYLDNGNDYGFVRSRPRLRSTNAILLRGGSEDQDLMSKSSSSYMGRNNDHESALSDREIGMSSSYRDASGQYNHHHHHHHHNDGEKSRQDSKNPLRGALILFTASTSSWWKSKQREEQLNQQQQQPPPSSERTSKWASSNGGSSGISASAAAAATTSPMFERRWGATTSSSNGSLVSPMKDSGKWSVILTPDRRGVNSERKWSTPVSSTSSSTNQDRKWRSLGALLRTPVGGSVSSSNANGSSQSRSSQTSIYHNASMSMIEDCERIHINDTSSTLDNGYYRRGGVPCPASTSRLMSKSSGDYSLSNGRSKVGRRLFQPQEDIEMDESEAKDDCPRMNDQPQRGGGGGGGISSTNKSARAQSFYLLDDFLRPQPQSNGSISSSTAVNGVSGSKCSLDHYLSSPYRSSTERIGSSDATNGGRQYAAMTTGGSAATTTSTTGAGMNGPRSNVLTNITPPRRHNSSSDSLEVATSPLPPPVPPPPPQISSTRDREKLDRDWAETYSREKDLCRCRMCWTGLQQQRSLHGEVSFFICCFLTFILSLLYL